MRRLEVKEMETERSIVLQKKMILFLSFIIVAIFSLILVRENGKNLKEIYVSEAEKKKLDLVTVNVAENEILRENVKFLAVSVVSGENKGEIEAPKYELALVPNEENISQDFSESGELDVVEEIKVEEQKEERRK